mmetsp:Transcript_110922/g.312698  ORF Transcript_110922/g.312698 Transcript_110922/m.312698 type:complete len:549 (-) Transcript_110922:246-1892(-)
MIGPAMGPCTREGAAAKKGPMSNPANGKSSGNPLMGPSTKIGPIVRRATIGPAAPPLGPAEAAAAASQARQARAIADAAAANADRGLAGRADRGSGGDAVVDTKAVTLCRSGELPPKGWGTKWNVATKRAALVASVEAAQMHVVYALRPRSSMFQSDVGAAELEQSELDRLLQAHALGKAQAKKAASKEAIKWLLEEGASLEVMCSSADNDVRGAAASILTGGTLEVDDAARRAANLLQAEDWQSKATAAEVFGRIAVEAARPHAAALARLLGDEQAIVRMAAVTALARLGAEVAAPPCAAALAACKPRAREAAAEVLGKLGQAAAAYAAQVASLLEDKDWQVPTAAATALKRIGDAAAPHVAEVLARCEQTSKAAASEALTRIGGAAAADAAAGLLTSDDSGVRRHAADVLGALGPDHSAAHLQALAALAADSDREVRRAARNASLKLGGRLGPARVVGDGDALPDAVAAAVAAGTGEGACQSGKSKGKGKGAKASASASGGHSRAMEASAGHRAGGASSRRASASPHRRRAGHCSRSRSRGRRRGH